jgi:hypothetical protein
VQAETFGHAAHAPSDAETDEPRLHDGDALLTSIMRLVGQIGEQSIPVWWNNLEHIMMVVDDPG